MLISLHHYDIIFEENKGTLNAEITGQWVSFCRISEQYDAKVQHNNRCGILFLFGRYFEEELHVPRKIGGIGIMNPGIELQRMRKTSQFAMDFHDENAPNGQHDSIWMYSSGGHVLSA